MNVSNLTHSTSFAKFTHIHTHTNTLTHRTLTPHLTHTTLMWHYTLHVLHLTLNQLSSVPAPHSPYLKAWWNGDHRTLHASQLSSVYFRLSTKTEYVSSNRWLVLWCVCFHYFWGSVTVGGWGREPGLKQFPDTSSCSCGWGEEGGVGGDLLYWVPHDKPVGQITETFCQFGHCYLIMRTFAFDDMYCSLYTAMGQSNHAPLSFLWGHAKWPIHLGGSSEEAEANL